MSDEYERLSSGQSESGPEPSGADPHSRRAEIPASERGKTDYTPQDLQHLSDMEHVRKRPAMYIGDLDQPRLAPLGV